jgi:hypothetical protein
VICATVSSHVQAQEDGASPDAARTVEAFRGHWIFTAKDTEPGLKAPIEFGATFDCKPAALGAAVSCDIVALPPDGSDRSRARPKASPFSI